MSSTNISAPAPADDTGFLAQLLPNRGRVTFLRGLIRIFLAVGVLAGLSLIWDVYPGLACAPHLAGCGWRSSLSQSERFKRPSGGNHHREAHQVLGGVRSEICRAGGSM